MSFHPSILVQTFFPAHNRLTRTPKLASLLQTLYLAPLVVLPQTWSESAFGAEDEDITADDGSAGGDDWAEGMGDDVEDGGGVVGTLKKIYSLFGGDD